MTAISHAAGARRRLHRGERLEFKALLAATYPLFLIAVLAERIGARLDGGTRSGAKRSVFAEAYETAAAALAQAFMG